MPARAWILYGCNGEHMANTIRKTFNGRRVRLMMIVWAWLLPMWPAAAATDLLELPAKMSVKASRSIMLAAGLAGKRMLVAGERGIILYSDDGGKNWNQSVVPVSVTLTALFFVNGRTGWATGHDGVVLRSDDAGKSWIKQLDGYRANALIRAEAEARLKQARTALEQGGVDLAARKEALERAQFSLDDVIAGAQFGPSRPLLGAWFDNERDGYVVGANGQILVTRDGGRNWRSLGNALNNPDALHYNAIGGGAAGQKIIAGEGGKVYRSKRDDVWQTLDTGYNGPLYGVLRFAQGDDGEVLLAYGFGGRIFRSADGGKTWRHVAEGLLNATLVAGVQLKNGALVLLAQDGTLLLSRDQGQSFTRHAAPAGQRVAAMAALPDDSALLVAGVGGARLITLAEIDK
jgi:photosystem II stability/assembly factor-like uncharacterized protein